MKYYVYNPKSNNGIKVKAQGAKLIDATKLNYPEFFSDLAPEDEVVLIGGDGTINYLINHIDLTKLKNKIWFRGNGTGNDFLHDIDQPADGEVLLNPYLTVLPTVTVKGKSYKFINNMALGIDGYCCEVADKIRAKQPNKKINYAGIAVKGLLWGFSPCKAIVEVDGKKYKFDHVWMAPTMKGRFYGGGMKAAPDQDRSSDHLTVVVSCCKSRLKLLKVFPSFFEGKHVSRTDIVSIFTGNKVHVRFSRPCASMIDGETVLNVTEYWAEL